MTNLLDAPSPPVPPPAPAPPARPKQRINWSILLITAAVVAAAAAVLVFASMGLSQWLRSAPAAVASVNQPFQHAEGVPVCAASLATAWNDARAGTGGQVNVQGPGVVIVDVGYEGRTRELQQQLTYHDSSMTWDMPLYAQVDSITISVKTNTSFSMCQIGSPAYPGVTRSRPLYGVVS